MTTIYHNPRCSKSRATLQLLIDQGIQPEVVLYLENTPDVATLKKITQQMNCSISDILRKGEAAYKEGNIADQSLSEEQLIDLVVQTPILLERPIVQHKGRAVVGRPPENILKIL